MKISSKNTGAVRYLFGLGTKVKKHVTIIFMSLIHVLLSAFLMISSLSYATSFIERPFEEVVRDAPFIVRGTVGSSSSDWASSADGSKRIYTFTTLALKETLKGKLSKSEIVLRQLGGTKDGQGIEVSGTAVFNPGQDVVVTIGDENPDGSHEVWGMMMGKFNVIKAASGEESIIGPGISENDETDQGGIVDDHDSGGEHRGHGKIPKWSLSNLREMIAKQDDEQKEVRESRGNGTEKSGGKGTPQTTTNPSSSKSGSGKDFQVYSPAKTTTASQDPKSTIVSQELGATGLQVLVVFALIFGTVVFVIRRG